MSKLARRRTAVPSPAPRRRFAMEPGRSWQPRDLTRIFTTPSTRWLRCVNPDALYLAACRATVTPAYGRRRPVEEFDRGGQPARRPHPLHLGQRRLRDCGQHTRSSVLVVPRIRGRESRAARSRPPTILRPMTARRHEVPTEIASRPSRCGACEERLHAPSPQELDSRPSSGAVLQSRSSTTTPTPPPMPPGAAAPVPVALPFCALSPLHRPRDKVVVQGRTTAALAAELIMNTVTATRALAEARRRRSRLRRRRWRSRKRRKPGVLRAKFYFAALISSGSRSRCGWCRSCRRRRPADSREFGNKHVSIGCRRGALRWQ